MMDRLFFSFIEKRFDNETIMVQIHVVCKKLKYSILEKKVE